MRKIVQPLIILVLLFSCRSEEDVSPSNAATFVRYFGSEYSHTAVLALEVNEGYTLLSTVEVPTSNLNQSNYRMKLIRTDKFGHVEWSESYTRESDTEFGYRASSFIPYYSGSEPNRTLEGYLIIGDRIYESADQSVKTDLQLVKVPLDGNPEGIVVGSFSPSDPDLSLEGKAVVQNDQGDIFILGAIKESPLDMYTAKISISGTSFTKVWSREYGNATGTLLNRLFVDSSNKLFWGGTYQNPEETDFRLVGAAEDTNPDVENMIGDGTFSETAFDLEQTIGGFAMVGSKTSVSGDENIYFTKVGQNGVPFVNPEPIDFNGFNDKAVSICAGHDGGYWILGTVESGADRGNGSTDLYLCRINDLGQEIGVIKSIGDTDVFIPTYSLNYGGSDNEEGASIRKVQGGYLVFGTSTYGTQKKLMLMKVNTIGKL
jgi:hypothetical protein